MCWMDLLLHISGVEVDRCIWHLSQLSFYVVIIFPLLPVSKHAANLEQKQNDAENKKVHGDVVKYGSVIQVRAQNE